MSEQPQDSPTDQSPTGDITKDWQLVAKAPIANQGFNRNSLQSFPIYFNNISNFQAGQ